MEAACMEDQAVPMVLAQPPLQHRLVVALVLVALGRDWGCRQLQALRATLSSSSTPTSQAKTHPVLQKLFRLLR